MLKSSILQTQLKLNAQALCLEYADISCLRDFRRYYFESGEKEQGMIYTPFINKANKRIKTLEAVQKFMKAELKEAYFYENFGKTWEAFEPIGEEM